MATDSLGITASSTLVNVTVVDTPPPSLQLTSPASSASYAAGATIPLSATAASGSSAGGIAKVEFLNGTTVIAQVTAAPFIANWANVPPGNYTVKAVATDSSGVQAPSAIASVRVTNSGITITSPAPGQTISGGETLVQGTVQAPDNSGVLVNGAPAVIDEGGKFYARLPIPAGSVDLTATLTTPDGQTTTHTVSVFGDGSSPLLEVAQDPVQGPSPLSVKYTITNISDVTVNFAFDGGALTQISPAQTLTGTFNYQGSGAATFFNTITATGGGRTTNQTYVVVMDEGPTLDRKLQAIWSSFTNSLAAGDRATALKFMSETARSKYGPIFDALQQELPSIVSSMSAAQPGHSNANYAEYVLTRELDGVKNVFFLYFLKDATGVWRLESM